MIIKRLNRKSSVKIRVSKTTFQFFSTANCFLRHCSFFPLSWTPVDIRCKRQSLLLTNSATLQLCVLWVGWSTKQRGGPEARREFGVEKCKVIFLFRVCFFPGCKIIQFCCCWHTSLARPCLFLAWPPCSNLSVFTHKKPEEEEKTRSE